MTDHAKGYTVFIAALGLMAGLLSPEISGLPSWSAALAPAFVGKVLMHFGVVVTAFIGGKLIPTGV